MEAARVDRVGTRCKWYSCFCAARTRACHYGRDRRRDRHFIAAISRNACIDRLFESPRVAAIGGERDAWVGGSGPCAAEPRRQEQHAPTDATSLQKKH